MTNQITHSEYQTRINQFATQMRDYLKNFDRDDLALHALACGIKAKRTWATHDIISAIVKSKYQTDGLNSTPIKSTSYTCEPKNLLNELKDDFQDFKANWNCN